MNSFVQSNKRCRDWSGKQLAELQPKRLLDVGCYDGGFLFEYLNYKPELLAGVEAAPGLRKKAEARGIQTAAVDLNGPWPYESNSFDLVHSSQVIEHLHNTRMFVQETFRVLKPGGLALITSENLTSFLNLGAMLFGYTPFSLMRVCGWYLGNPLGLHYQEEVPEDVPVTDPSYAGVTGHIRVMSVIQAQEFFEKIGFETEARSIGLIPIPDGVGRVLEKWMYRRGHFLLVSARKPPGPATRA